MNMIKVALTPRVFRPLNYYTKSGKKERKREKQKKITIR